MTDIKNLKTVHSKNYFSKIFGLAPPPLTNISFERSILEKNVRKQTPIIFQFSKLQFLDKILGAKFLRKNCSFEALTIVFEKIKESVQPLKLKNNTFRHFFLGCFFQKIWWSGGKALILGFLKNNFWNCHIICS